MIIASTNRPLRTSQAGLPYRNARDGVGDDDDNLRALCIVRHDTERPAQERSTGGRQRGGRAAIQMIVRELSQMEVSGYPPVMDQGSGRVLSGNKSFHLRLRRTAVARLSVRRVDGEATTSDLARDLGQTFCRTLLLPVVANLASTSRVSVWSMWERDWDAGSLRNCRVARRIRVPRWSTSRWHLICTLTPLSRSHRFGPVPADHRRGNSFSYHGV